MADSRVVDVHIVEAQFFELRGQAAAEQFGALAAERVVVSLAVCLLR
jgi:hypothetical protein